MIAITMHNNANNFTWAFQLLKNISRFAQSGVSSNLWSYQAFPQKVRRGMSWLHFPSAWPSSQSSHQYFASNPHIQVVFCLIARSQNYTNLPDSWICGHLQVFAGVLWVILGAVTRIYMCWCSGYENGLVYLPGTQPGCKPCSVIFKMSLVVIVWPLGSKTRQTSRIRGDSENWFILGQTPKLPKIIDRRNVQVEKKSEILSCRHVFFCVRQPLNWPSSFTTSP